MRSARPCSPIPSKFPHEGDCEWQAIKATSWSNIPGVESSSPEAKTSASQPVSRPDNGWASVSRRLNTELNWQARYKPLHDSVNMSTIWSETRYLPSIRTGLIPALKPDLMLVGSYIPQNGSSSMELTNLMIITQNLFTLREINQMEREVYLRMILHSKRFVWRIFKLPDRTALRRLLNRVIGELEVRRRN